MKLFIVVSYFPRIPGPAKVRVDGIYTCYKKAVERQTIVCGGSFTNNICGNSVSGKNGRISWIKATLMGDQDSYDMYIPD